MDIITVLFIVFFVWLLGLSCFLVWFIWQFKVLLKDVKEKNFLKVFKKIQDIQTLNTSEIKNLRENFDKHVSSSISHLQKLGLVKFNPFKEVGGDHSFSLSILDGKKNGIIMTSLHGREGTRTYIKDVKGGKSNIELSKEERALLNAEN